MHISEFSLQLIAALLGFAGTALVILQAFIGLPSAHANRGVLILTTFVPVIAAIVFALVPHRVQQYLTHGYALQSPVVWITVGLPVLLTILLMILINVSGNFNNFAGLAMLLAANAGRNLRDLVRVTILQRMHTHSS